MLLKCSPSLSALVLVIALCAGNAWAQSSRVAQVIDNNKRTVIPGHLHPKADAARDQGRVAPSLEIPYVTLSLAPSPAQQADLEKLLVAQQTPGSPDYQRWLTPEDYAQRFGVSDADIAKLTGWLAGQGLNVISTARARNWIAVSGSAAQIEAAFQTEIHTFAVNGETHYSNASEPSLPAAFGAVVKGIRGLNDFRMKPRKASYAKPAYDSGGSTHYLAPDDVATIYDIAPLYAAGVNGSGQTIAVAGQTQVNLSDIELFRTKFNLPANDPQTLLVPGSRNPGISTDDLAESDLDLEWAGAIARNATIIFVYTNDVMTAVQYAIDQHLAPVVSLSYGVCELETPASEVAAFQQWAQQANALGITWLASSGDNGGADCDDSQNPGLAVDLPGSVPGVTSVGATQLAEGGGSYWSASNGANGGSALSYIPETTWNTSTADGLPAASGGGASVLFAKPSWQTGPGVPGDNARHVPDISLSGSPDHDGYLVYTGGSLQIYGGTSVSAPSFAGLTVLLNQALGSGGVGNINPKLYSLAQTTSGIFHDVTTGNNIVTVSCARKMPNCGAVPVGFSAGAGYDQATGLGSVDAYNLVNGWNGTIVTPPPVSVPTVTLLSNLSTVGPNQALYLVATVTSTSGTTPSGLVAFSSGGTALGSVALTGSAGTATAALVVTGSQLPAGAGTITAAYSTATSASVTIAVTASGSGSTGTPSVAGVANAASFQQSFAPGSILSVFGSQLSQSTQSAASVPLPISAGGVAALINGIAAPLYYISSGQLNIQIPYEVAANSTAVLSINNNGQTTTRPFQVAATAPGIFTDSTGALVPTKTAARGQEIALYITGAGAVSPAVSTGAAPDSTTALSNLPAPVQPTTVTVGGVTASIDFIGIPYGLVGVTQINFQVPIVPLGTQMVVVKVGGIASAAAKLTITN